MLKYLKYFIILIVIIIIVLSIRTQLSQIQKESFESKYLSKNKGEKKGKNENEKEGFISNQCPTTMIKKGNQIYLYNPKLAKVPGVNPIVLSSLKEYEDYVKWQRASNIDCPILHLERMYDTQGFEQYEIKPSFMLDQPNGPLNHDLPVMHKTPNVNEILNAHLDNNLPYNKNQYPAFDPYNQNVGVMTIHDLDGSNPNTKLPIEYTS